MKRTVDGTPNRGSQPSASGLAQECCQPAMNRWAISVVRYRGLMLASLFGKDSPKQTQFQSNSSKPALRVSQLCEYSRLKAGE